MRILVVFILFLLLGVTETPSHQVAENLSVTSPQTTSESQYLGDSASFHESQIRIADSLYKNYLPQYNFDEVKAAMEFFDSIRNDELAIRNYGRRKAIPNSTFLIPNYQCAKAHYYHAVGLTEKDDIVGACEHYLIALEIMEDLMAKDKSLRKKDKRLKAKVDNPEEYEKIRFIALIYNRLGRLFYNASYCDLAIIKYRKAIDYVNLINDNSFKANLLKELANSYHLANNADSALCYYNKSLETNSNLTNKLDVEKCIAQILFDKGEKDNAYILIKNNIDKIVDYASKDSYYCILGTMYYKDNVYDSAIYYIEKSVRSNNNYIKNKSSLILSAIYDSIGNHDKKTYFEKIVSKLSMNMVNKSVVRGEIQDVYNRYKERIVEKEKYKSRTRTKVIVISLSLLIIISFVITILIWQKSKRKDKKYHESLKIISKTKDEIKRKEFEIKKLVGMLEDHKLVIKSLMDDVSIKKQEISGKETDIKKMENDLSAKERELKRLQENVHENRILIDRLKEDKIAKEKQIECYLGEINDKRQVINDKNHLISIVTKGLVVRNDTIAENRNEIARLQAIIDENGKIIKKLSEDHKNNEERIAVHLEEIEKLKTEINQSQKNIIDLRFKSSLTEGKIKKQNAELKKKEELIGEYTAEISNLKYRLKRTRIDVSNLNNYLQSDVCSKILNEIKEISEKKLKSNTLSLLSKEELVLLLNSANHHLNYFINDMANKYPKLKKEDLYYLCLVIMGLDNYQIASLFGVTYHASKKRKNKICVILGLDSKTNLHNYLLQLI